MCGPILNDTLLEYSNQLGGGEERLRATPELLDRPPLDARPPERDEPAVRPPTEGLEEMPPGREVPDLD